MRWKSGRPSFSAQARNVLNLAVLKGLKGKGRRDPPHSKNWYSTCWPTKAFQIVRNGKAGTGLQSLQPGPLKEPEDVKAGRSLSVDAGKSGVKIGNEIRIHVPWGIIAGKLWGDPKGSPVLGIHGWTDSAATFDKLAPSLLKSIGFIAVDLPGHGHSSQYPPGMQYHFMDFVLVIKRIVMYLGWTKFSIIGHSMGGGLGSIYGSLFPDEVDSLVLMDLPKYISYPLSGYGAKLAMSLERYLRDESSVGSVPRIYTYEEVLDRMIKKPFRGQRESREILMGRAGVLGEDKYYLRMDPRLREGFCRNRFVHEVMLEVLSKIRCRVLYIGSTEEVISWGDQEAQAKALEIYRENCAEFWEDTVEGSHFFHLDSPTETGRIINDFFIRKKSKL